MVEGSKMQLTDAEAELYDRQIRLWGLDSQKRLRGARILLIGLKGLGAEVAKNIILAGVATITLLDCTVVDELDACAQFLAPLNDRGKNRAQSSLSRAQALNPLVKVIADATPIEEKPDDFYRNFDVVVATELSLEELQRINQLCRARNVKFLCGDVWGMFGFTFSDLLIHSFTEEVTVAGSKSKDTRCVHKFVSLTEALSVDWTAGYLVKQKEEKDFSYILMRVLMMFREEAGRDPHPRKRNVDLPWLIELKKKMVNTPPGTLPDVIPDSVLGMCFAEVSPVCAIVGGVLAQEVVKVVSQREAPNCNFFFFNPIKCCGFVEKHRPEKKAEKRASTTTSDSNPTKKANLQVA